MSIENVLTRIGQHLDKIVFNIRRWTSRAYTLMGNIIRRNYFSSIASYHRILILDTFCAFISILISIYLRIGIDLLDYSLFYILKHMLVFSLISASAFLWCRTNLPFWRYITIDDMSSIFLSVIISHILFFPLMMLMNSSDFLPYSILVINIFVLCFCLIFPRCICREINIRKRMGRAVLHNTLKKPQALLIGDIQSVKTFCQTLLTSEIEEHSFEFIGIVTIEPDDIGRTISGIPIIGGLSDINTIIRQRRSTEGEIQNIIMIGDSMAEDEEQFIRKVVSKYGITITKAKFLHEITE